MITRFQPVTCPACNHTGKPVAKEPGSESVNGVLNFVPGVGTAYSAWRITGAKLYCAACGHQLTESLQTKAVAAVTQARDRAAQLAANLQSSACPACHTQIPDSNARFCPECGTRVR
jgi:hypothetical protein